MRVARKGLALLVCTWAAVCSGEDKAEEGTQLLAHHEVRADPKSGTSWTAAGETLELVVSVINTGQVQASDIKISLGNEWPHNNIQLFSAAGQKLHTDKPIAKIASLESGALYRETLSFKAKEPFVLESPLMHIEYHNGHSKRQGNVHGEPFTLMPNVVFQRLTTSYFLEGTRFTLFVSIFWFVPFVVWAYARRSFFALFNSV